MNAEELSSEEISRRITTGMGLVYDLFKEVNSLFRRIAQGLENSDTGVQPLVLGGIVLPRNKKTASGVDKFLKTDMGLLAKIGTDNASDLVEESDDAADDADQEEETDKVTLAITPETKFFGIRAILFDPQASDPTKFQPVLVAGIIGSLSRKSKGSKKNVGPQTLETTFPVRRTAIKRLVKQLDAEVLDGQTIKTHAPGGAINATLADVDITPLAKITTEQLVEEYVDKLVAMVVKVEG